MKSEKVYYDSEGNPVIIKESIRVGAKHFWKVFEAFFTVMDLLGTAKMKVLIAIIQKTSATNNEVTVTYEEIYNRIKEKQRPVSLASIGRVFSALQKANFIVKIRNGKWMVNPDFLIKGDEGKRSKLLTAYYEYKSLATRDESAESTPELNEIRAELFGKKSEQEE